jgi:hypothetical protein
VEGFFVSDIQNRFVRVLASGIIGWLLSLIVLFLSTIGIDPESGNGQLIIGWLKSFEPVLVIVLGAAANALIAWLVEKFPNMSWMERLLNPFNNRVPVYMPKDKV